MRVGWGVGGGGGGWGWGGGGVGWGGVGAPPKVSFRVSQMLLFLKKYRFA